MTLVEELHKTGIRRSGSPKQGFRFAGAKAQDLARSRALAIPPAWTEVAISRSKGSRLQAVGKDAKDRWQYRYSELAVREREAKKFGRLLKFAKALPAMRHAIDRDLRRQDLGRARVMAGIRQQGLHPGERQLRPLHPAQPPRPGARRRGRVRLHRQVAQEAEAHAARPARREARAGLDRAAGSRAVPVRRRRRGGREHPAPPHDRPAQAHRPGRQGDRGPAKWAAATRPESALLVLSQTPPAQVAQLWP